jgi:hypothetical protein
VREYNGVSITHVTAELGSRYPASAKFSEKRRRELLSVDMRQLLHHHILKKRVRGQ